MPGEVTWTQVDGSTQRQPPPGPASLAFHPPPEKEHRGRVKPRLQTAGLDVSLTSPWARDHRGGQLGDTDRRGTGSWGACLPPCPTKHRCP